MGWRDPILRGLAAGRPETGPVSVHLDVTNACNAACGTCWDHSPHLTTPRPAAWKRRRLPLDRFVAITDALAAFGSVRHVVISGMGEPLTHPDIYAMIARTKALGWETTVITNLVAADADALAASGVDQLLVGVQGVTPATHAAFHPGWDTSHYFAMVGVLRRLQATDTRVRHVQVIDRHTAPELVEMVRFAHRFGADRVNYKLAALRDGTEAVAITDDQRAWMRAEGVPAARALAAKLGVRTNLPLFERQLDAGGRATAPVADVGCYMGHVFTRITVDEDVLFCCNVNVKVGSLRDRPFADWWWGDDWQALRDRMAARDFLPACDQCGKIEQNTKWAERLAAAAS